MRYFRSLLSATTILHIFFFTAKYEFVRFAFFLLPFSRLKPYSGMTTLHVSDLYKVVRGCLSPYNTTCTHTHAIRLLLLRRVYLYSRKSIQLSGSFVVALKSDRGTQYDVLPHCILHEYSSSCNRIQNTQYSHCFPF